MSPKKLSLDERNRLFMTKTYILNHLHERLPVSFLARMAVMTEPRFREGFLKVFGMRIRDYVQEARMAFGYFLIVHSDKPIKEIAALSGYDYTQNFMIAFRKQYGCTPGSIRNEEEDASLS